MRWFLPPWCVAESHELSYELWTVARENSVSWVGVRGRPPKVGILDLEIGNWWKKNRSERAKDTGVTEGNITNSDIVFLCSYCILRYGSRCGRSRWPNDLLCGKKIQLKGWLTLTRRDLRWDELYRTEYVQTQTKPVILACPAFSKF